MSNHHHKAQCACGAVELSVTGEPIFVGYCHCNDCRDWIGAPVHGATLWPKDSVQIIKGADHLITYKRTEESHRKSCATCGSAVFVDHPNIGLYDILAATMKDLTFTPTMHVHYSQRMIPMVDGLPKFSDMPAEFGGSGKQLEE